MSRFDESLGLRIQGHRISLGLGQTALAESIGVRQQKISKFELGQCSMTAEQMYEIARHLGTTPNNLVYPCYYDTWTSRLIRLLFWRVRRWKITMCTR